LLADGVEGREQVGVDGQGVASLTVGVEIEDEVLAVLGVADEVQFDHAASTPLVPPRWHGFPAR
jgi:hypothetical protein